MITIKKKNIGDLETAAQLYMYVSKKKKNSPIYIIAGPMLCLMLASSLLLSNPLLYSNYLL